MAALNGIVNVLASQPNRIGCNSAANQCVCSDQYLIRVIYPVIFWVHIGLGMSICMYIYAYICIYKHIDVPELRLNVYNLKFS